MVDIPYDRVIQEYVRLVFVFLLYSITYAVPPVIVSLVEGWNSRGLIHVEMVESVYDGRSESLIEIYLERHVRWCAFNLSIPHQFNQLSIPQLVWKPYEWLHPVIAGNLVRRENTDNLGPALPLLHSSNPTPHPVPSPRRD